jgi:hypothetical protein
MFPWRQLPPLSNSLTILAHSQAVPMFWRSTPIPRVFDWVDRLDQGAPARATLRRGSSHEGTAVMRARIADIRISEESQARKGISPFIASGERNARVSRLKPSLHGRLTISSSSQTMKGLPDHHVNLSLSSSLSHRGHHAARARASTYSRPLALTRSSALSAPGRGF